MSTDDRGPAYYPKTCPSGRDPRSGAAVIAAGHAARSNLAGIAKKILACAATGSVTQLNLSQRLGSQRSPLRCD
jgi:hypothetical protein